ncbi:MAG TPA: hypothetical protein DET40_16980 [Lentisphaeria bacterium]|nr:MAG: hypothetical protein A2X45_19260 [Lentisphaerae bacterium GWF2_50_93]HCE45236.1 hypothetical protein [Lentisphaeria bacterium]
MNTEEINNKGAKKPFSGIAKAFMVIGIVGAVLLIESLLFPPLRSERAESRKIKCNINLKHIGIAIHTYSQDNKGQYPDKNGAEGLEMLRAGGYLENPKMYTCPSSTTVPAKEGEKLTEANVDYVYIGGYSDSESVSANTAIAYDKPANHHKYGNILFAFGDVQGYAGANWMNYDKK